jgi:hypothetical protein
MGNDGAAQMLLEEQANCILKNDEDNISWRLAVIEGADGELEDDDPDNDGRATTNKIESQFAIQEYFANDNRIVSQLIERTGETTVAGCSGHQIQAERELERAISEYYMAQDAVSDCEVGIDCAMKDYKTWLKHLGWSYQRVSKASKFCTGYDPNKPCQ